MTEQTDRELLEMAAKARGLSLGYDEGQYFYSEHGPFGASMYGKQGNSPLHWNPLTDGGDAIGLAALLRMDITQNHPADRDAWVCAETLEGPKFRRALVYVPDEVRRLECMCRAITRAAAEI